MTKTGTTLEKDGGDTMEHGEPIPATATCTLCKEEKPLWDFESNPNKKNGKHSHCKACRSHYYKAYYKKYYQDRKEAYRIRAATNYQKRKQS